MTLDNGDVYTGELDAEGRRQGHGRCEYYSAEGVGGSYSGDWDADQPHGIGERLYPARGTSGVDEDEDDIVAVAAAAFGPDCPPLASYTGGWKRGVRHGNGVCTFAVAPSAGGATAAAGSPGGQTRGGARRVTVSAATSASTATVPESYDGEWADGRPLASGTLFLRSRAVAGSSALKRSGAAGAVRGGGGRRSYLNGGSIDGVWAAEGGLIHGREKLPGKGGLYEGQYRLGKREGHGRLDLPDGSEYEGETLFWCRRRDVSKL